MAGQKQTAGLKDSEVDINQNAISPKVASTDGFWRGFAAASILAIGLSGILCDATSSAFVASLVNTQVIDTEVTLIIDSPENIYNADFK